VTSLLAVDEGKIRKYRLTHLIKADRKWDLHLIEKQRTLSMTAGCATDGRARRRWKPELREGPQDLDLNASGRDPRHRASNCDPMGIGSKFRALDPSESLDDDAVVGKLSAVWQSLISNQQVIKLNNGMIGKNDVKTPGGRWGRAVHKADNIALKLGILFGLRGLESFLCIIHWIELSPLMRVVQPPLEQHVSLARHLRAGVGAAFPSPQSVEDSAAPVGRDGESQQSAG
jgi:hypothetical protein